MHLGLDLARFQIAALDALQYRLRTANGAGEAAQLMQTHIVGFQVGEQCFQAHRGGDLGLLEPAIHIIQMQGAHGGEQIRAVDGRQSIARLQIRDGNTRPFHRHVTGQSLALIECLAFAQQQQSELGHRSQITAGADRAFLTHDRCEALVEHLDQGQRDLRPAAGIAVRVDVDAAGHRGAHVLDRGRLADARRVIVDQVTLELQHLLVGQDDFGKLADAGVGAIHDLARFEFLLQHGAAHLDALQRFGREFHVARRHARRAPIFRASSRNHLTRSSCCFSLKMGWVLGMVNSEQAVGYHQTTKDDEAG